MGAVGQPAGGSQVACQISQATVSIEPTRVWHQLDGPTADLLRLNPGDRPAIDD